MWNHIFFILQGLKIFGCFSKKRNSLTGWCKLISGRYKSLLLKKSVTFCPISFTVSSTALFLIQLLTSYSSSFSFVIKILLIVDVIENTVQVALSAPTLDTKAPSIPVLSFYKRIGIIKICHLHIWPVPQQFDAPAGIIKFVWIFYLWLPDIITTDSKVTH